MQAKLEDNNVFKEICSTENTYNASLKFLHLSLLIQLQFDEHTLLRKFYTLIEQLIDVSDKLILNVENGLANTDNPGAREVLKLDRLSLLSQFFELYKSYSTLFDEYALACKSNPEQFKQINFYMTQNSGTRLGFESHLIMPIQRGPRYELLIKEIQKHNIGDEFNRSEFSILEDLINDRLSDFSSKKKTEPKSESRDSEKHPYRFGDYTRYYLFGYIDSTAPDKDSDLSHLEKDSEMIEKSETLNEKHIEEHATSSEARGYRFGDLTRRLIWGTNNHSQVENTTVAPGQVESNQVNTEQEKDYGFELTS